MKNATRSAMRTPGAYFPMTQMVVMTIAVARTMPVALASLRPLIRRTASMSLLIAFIVVSLKRVRWVSDLKLNNLCI